MILFPDTPPPREAYCNEYILSGLFPDTFIRSGILSAAARDRIGTGQTGHMTDSNPLLISPDDPALGQVISGHLQCDLVAGKNTDKVLAELAADVCKDDSSVFEFHLEHCVREFFCYDAFKFDNICF